MNFIRTLVAASLAALAFGAQAQTTGFVKNLEIHVGTQQLRFGVVNNGTNQVFCGSSTTAYFPLVAGTTYSTYTWTQANIDALSSHAYMARAAAIEVDVYTVANGSTCMIIDIVLK